MKGTLGFSVLRYWPVFQTVFPVGYLILNDRGIAVFSNPAGCVFFAFWSVVCKKTYPSLFSIVSGRFGSNLK